MKKANCFIVIVLLLSNINLLAQQKANTANNPEIMVGNDRDSHGCIGSAGYVWSALKKNCIRTFEMHQLDKNSVTLASLDKTQNMVILFNEDYSKAEIFYAGGTFLIPKSAKEKAYLIKNGKTITHKLYEEAGKWQFVKINHKKSEILYQ